MQIPKELTTVTAVSKAVALIMFITLPIIAFLFGMRYQTMLIEQNKIPALTLPTPAPIACTLDAKICPDGTSVGRIPPKCEFEVCPQKNTTKGKTFTGPITSINYACHMDGQCTVGIGKAMVIVDAGESLQTQERGTFPEGLLDEAKLNNFLKKEVEVYAETYKGRTDSYTLFGSKDFYIKLVEPKPTGTFCGGIAGKICPAGYYCKYDGTYPDAGGTCIKTETKTTYTCPKTQWVDCEPGPDKPNKIECSPAFLRWAQENCPGFQGAAL
jgi:hypothetical protein